MKKIKNLWKVWTIVAVVMTFIVTYTVVYAAGSYFHSKYGKNNGVLADGVLTVDEWDQLMEDLDTYSCSNQSCPTCPECPTCDCGCTNWRMEPPANNHEIIESKENYYYFSNSAGLPISGFPGIMRPCWYNDCGSPAPNGDKNWTMYKSFTKGSTLAVQFTDTCSNISPKSGIYIMSNNKWYQVSITCKSDSYGTVKIESEGFKPPRYCEKQP